MQAKVCVTAHLTNSEDARVQAPQGYNTGGRLNQLTPTEQHNNAKIKVVHLMYELDKSVSDSFLFFALDGEHLVLHPLRPLPAAVAAILVKMDAPHAVDKELGQVSAKTFQRQYVLVGIHNTSGVANKL